MPAKRNTNKLSQLYKTIDQKGLSQDAKETLKKLRLATANFNKKEGKEADAFNLFYNRLLAKKPTAIKTTKEYKEMVLEKKREVARKMMEAKKAKQESRQGQGSERDASRPAKPFGWRLKGKHNYRKPTRADISSGKAYYEARINRADSKRTKFPMLERGGSLDGKYVIYYKEFENGKLVVEKHKEFNSYLSAKRELKKLASSHEHSYLLTDMETFMDMYGDRFEYGGEMDEREYLVKFENQDSGDIEEISVMAASEKDAIQSAYDESGLSDNYEFVSVKKYAKGGYMADGGEVDKGGMIYALRNEISSGTIANKSGVDTYQEVARVRQEAIDYYLKNGDVPYSLGELDRVLSMSNKMANSDDMKNRRTLKFSDTVLYKGNMYAFVKRDGDVGFVSNSQGAWGMDGKFLPLRDILRSDLEQNLTDMYGNKFYIPPYDELIKMPYGFAKGGSMDDGRVFYTESHKLGHE